MTTSNDRGPRAKQEVDPPEAEVSDGVETETTDEEAPDQEAPDEEAPDEEAPEDDTPAFLQQFPHDPELNHLVTAFNAGDYRTVRRAAARLARQSEDEDVARAAAELMRRLAPDPLIKYLLYVSVALLVVLTFFAYGHGH